MKLMESEELKKLKESWGYFLSISEMMNKIKGVYRVTQLNTINEKDSNSDKIMTMHENMMKIQNTQ